VDLAAKRGVVGRGEPHARCAAFREIEGVEHPHLGVGIDERKSVAQRGGGRGSAAETLGVEEGQVVADGEGMEQEEGGDEDPAGGHEGPAEAGTFVGRHHENAKQRWRGLNGATGDRRGRRRGGR
jgi:hypothetical protein